MLRAAAAAGAAAWTAPAILDSVSSAAFAAAASGCIRYYAKLDSSGSCVDHDPSCGYTVPSGTKYVCCSDDSSGEDCPYDAKKPSLSTYSTNTDYYQVELKSGCYYSSTTTWQVVGNYNFQCVQLEGKAADADGPSSSYTGNGWYQAGGRKAWIKKKHNFGSGNVDFDYVYNLFCCGS